MGRIRSRRRSHRGAETPTDATGEPLHELLWFVGGIVSGLACRRVVVAYGAKPVVPQIACCEIGCSCLGVLGGFALLQQLCGCRRS